MKHKLVESEAKIRQFGGYMFLLSKTIGIVI